ncbi:GNAT family N-acetyltransferase [uncultured Draconibacterium sp.]|uniref:GNAT family N-acetyltransferase n=1 Tax=uncultured Draconibacterium sp. TaxID=1573823 RepID=UPI0029C941F4|nr:GNAT family N-acetyltransferase [uncultured Draconibacterium sp.]
MVEKYKFRIIFRNEIDDTLREVVAHLLKEQKKVQPPYEEKADRCKVICVVFDDERPVALGAIKIKTKSVFGRDKANVPELSNKFDDELGYIYVKSKYEGQGIASKVVSLLLKEFRNVNLMASTETTANPGMVKILKRFGFRHYGSTWHSSMEHKNELGLFLKMNRKD